MGILFLIIEIIIVGFLAVRIGTEAFDKGFSKGLFIFLTILIWISSRVIGNLIGYFLLGIGLKAVFLSWLLAIFTYILFFFIISKMKDEPFFNEHDAEWKQMNKNADPSETGKSEEK